jgi:hypothetical protein
VAPLANRDPVTGGLVGDLGVRPAVRQASVIRNRNAGACDNECCRDQRQESASHASMRPRDQQRPMASARSADQSNTARPMMLWPEARRSPRVGIAGATPTPSADTHATALRTE